MNPIAGLSTTGRRLHGPASDLVELVNESGYRHTAIVFHPEYRDHPAINSALTVVAGYLESPMVTGMVELFSHDTSEGAFVYPTGQATSVAELNRTFADFGEAPGVRAGLELMYAAGEILIEGAETGEGHGVYSHGGLTPWRVMIKPDGQVQIIGYALPQVEILRFHDDPQSIPREDSFRYCPPERMEAGAEDLSSDLFALALIAFELMTGKPVYDGLVNDIRAMASRAEGSRRLFRFRDQLPKSVQDFLKVCLRRDTEDRFQDGYAFMDALQAALGGSDIIGPSLMDVMSRAGNVPQRVGTPLQDGGATMMVTREKLAAMVEEQEEQPTRAAWKPPSRKRRASPRAKPAPEPTPEPAAPTPAPEPTPSPAEQLSASTDGPKWKRPSRRSRRNPRASADEQLEQPAATPAPAPPPEPEPAEPGPRRASSLASNIIGQGARKPPARRRAPPRRGGSVDEPAPPKPVEAAPPPAPEPEPPPAPRAPVRLPSRIRKAPSAAKEEPAPPVNLGPPPPPPGASPSPDIAPADDARPPRPDPTPAPPPPPPTAAEPAPAPPEPAPVPASPQPPPPPPPQPPPPPPPPPAPPEPEPEPEPAPEPAPAPAPAPEPVPASPKPEPKAKAKAKPKPKPKAKVSKPKPAPEPMEPPVGLPGLVDLAVRPPDALPTDGAKGEAKRYSLKLGKGSKARRFRLPVNQPVSEAVAKLVGMLLPLRTDASGRLVGWYRFAQGGERPAGNPEMGVFDDAKPIELVLVPNTLVSLPVRIEHDGGQIGLRLQLGVAVPASGIVDHIAELLSLPAGRWRLHAGDRTLQPHEILADLGELADVELVIRR